MLIIKSKSIKQKSGIKRVFNYINRKRSLITLENSRNIILEKNSEEAILEKFINNDSYRKRKKFSACIFHEILSFHPSNTKYLLNNPEILYDISSKYMALRSPNGLGYAKIHNDKKHVHIHFIFSSTELESSRSIRVSKEDFERVKKNIREYQRKRYPKLFDNSIKKSISRDFT